MSWENTIDYYRIINEMVKNRRGEWYSAEILLYSVNFEEVLHLQNQDKWNELVKLMIGKPNSKRWKKVRKTLDKATPIWRKMDKRSEMEEIVVGKLIKNGEICGTSILAENLLKMELGQNNKKCQSKEELALKVANNVLRKAREVAQSSGPLIFVKIDKGYYNLKLLHIIMRKRT